MSDVNEEEMLERQNDKDEDFNIDDYCNDFSDDSCSGTLEGDKEDKLSDKEKLKAQDENEGRPTVPGEHRFDKKLICIKYPGNVVNYDKAIETLGGIGAISKTIDTPNRRLELRFRPNDGYCKPACGDRHSANAFLLRVRVKKSRVKKVEETVTKDKTDISTDRTKDLDFDHTVQSEQACSENNGNEGQDKCCIVELAHQVQSCSVSNAGDPSDPSCRKTQASDDKCTNDTSIDTDKNTNKSKKDVPLTFDRDKYEDLSKDEEYELPRIKVLGQVETEFRFTNLCDFQYLPMTQSRTNPSKLECIYDKIYPVGIPPYSWLKNEVPFFLPPPAFSRMDTVQQYVPKTEMDSHPENVIGKNKRRKMGFTNFIYFSTPDVPTTAPAGIETAMKVKFVQTVHLEKVRKLFEERPIWSKNAIMYETQFSSERLKILLPSVAYYFMTGPWKIMWVKLGYDPRKDISARKYQTLDYRLKAMYGLDSSVKCKRISGYAIPYKSSCAAKPKTAVLTETMPEEQTQRKEQSLSENVYIYREGIVPPYRQMFYQYCDVLVDEIQTMLAKLPDPLPGAKCHEKRGFLPSGFDVQCREIINKQVRTVLRKQMNIPEDHPTSLPRRRKRGTKLTKLKTKRTKKKGSPSAKMSQDREENEKSNVEEDITDGNVPEALLPTTDD